MLACRSRGARSQRWDWAIMRCPGMRNQTRCPLVAAFLVQPRPTPSISLSSSTSTSQLSPKSLFLPLFTFFSPSPPSPRARPPSLACSAWLSISQPWWPSPVVSLLLRSFFPAPFCDSSPVTCTHRSPCVFQINPPIPVAAAAANIFPRPA